MGWVKVAKRMVKHPRVRNLSQPAKPGPKRAREKVVTGFIRAAAIKRSHLVRNEALEEHTAYQTAEGSWGMKNSTTLLPPYGYFPLAEPMGG